MTPAGAKEHTSQSGNWGQEAEPRPEEAGWGDPLELGHTGQMATIKGAKESRRVIPPPNWMSLSRRQGTVQADGPSCTFAGKRLHGHVVLGTLPNSSQQPTGLQTTGGREQSYKPAGPPVRLTKAVHEGFLRTRATDKLWGHWRRMEVWDGDWADWERQVIPFASWAPAHRGLTGQGDRATGGWLVFWRLPACCLLWFLPSYRPDSRIFESRRDRRSSGSVLRALSPRCPDNPPCTLS